MRISVNSFPAEEALVKQNTTQNAMCQVDTYIRVGKNRENILLDYKAAENQIMIELVIMEKIKTALQQNTNLASLTWDVEVPFDMELHVVGFFTLNMSPCEILVLIKSTIPSIRYFWYLLTTQANSQSKYKSNKLKTEENKDGPFHKFAVQQFEQTLQKISAIDLKQLIKTM